MFTKHILWIIFFIISVNISSIELKELLRAAELSNSSLEKSRIIQKKSIDDINKQKWIKDPKINLGFMENMHSVQYLQAMKFPTKTYYEKKSNQIISKILENNSENLLQKISLAISLNYYKLYYVEKKIELLKDKISYLEKLSDVVENKYINGKTSQHHLIEIKLKVIKLQDKISSLERNKQAKIQNEINYLTGFSFKSAEIRTENITPEFPVWEEIDLVKNAEANNPLFKITKDKIRKENFILKRKKQYIYPDLNFSLTREKNSMLDNVNYSFMLGFNLPLQLNNEKANITSQKYKIKAAKTEYKQTKENIKREIELLIINFRDFKRKVELYQKKVIPFSLHNLEIAETAYENEQINFMDYIATINQIIGNRLAYYEYLTQLLKTNARLESIITVIPGEENEKK